MDTPEPPLIDCRRCRRRTAGRLTWQLFKDGGRHLRLTCSVCGKFIRYVAQSPERMAAADRAERVVPTPLVIVVTPGWHGVEL